MKASQIENIINYLERKEVDVDCLKEDKKEHIKNRIILKTQQRFKKERHNIFTEKIIKIPLSSNDDKRLQSNDSIETYVYGKSKVIIHAKEKIKLISIIKQYKKWLTLMML